METATQYREFLNLSSWFSAEPWGTAWERGEIVGWNDKAENDVRELLSNDYEPPLDPDQEREIENIVATAERHLKSQ
jgi:hypothetical protein